MVVMFWVMSSARRKEQRERATLMGAMKKNDRVILRGGECGSIVDLRDDRVLIKVDESSNTKIWYLKDAVASIENEKPAEK
jgi:preprotein translocase subunit YajC